MYRSDVEQTRRDVHMLLAERFGAQGQRPLVESEGGAEVAAPLLEQ